MGCPDGYERGACIAGKPGSYRENMLAASIAFDLAVKVTRYKSETTLLWERACSRWQHIVPPDRTRVRER